MHNILFIGFGSQERVLKGTAYWKGESYYNIVENSDFTAINTDNTKQGIGYFTGQENAERKCVDLHIKTIKNKNNSLYIEFDYLEDTEYTSAAVKSSLYSAFSTESASRYIPFCYCMSEEHFYSVIEDESLLGDIKKLTSGNQWLKIYNKYFPISNIKSSGQFWDNAKILSALSFATAKLSEVYINLKQSFPDDKKRNDFLKQQKRYREETIELRKRCIELDAENPGYYSNLAYTYYQSCRELMMRGGRRDGNLKQEAEQAIEYFNLTLDLDPNRITDLYRKGQVLSKILYNQLLFIKKNNKAEAEKANKVLKEAIQCYLKVEEVYELLPEIDEKSLQRYHKEYVKSLYSCADAYHNFQTINWHYADIFLERENNVFSRDTKFTDLALRYAEKCVDCDNQIPTKTKMKMETLITAKHNGAVEAVYKLYFLGKLNLMKYILLTDSGNTENLPAEIHCANAERYFLAALSYPFSKQMQRMGKGFIAEKLARLYIIKKEYKEAQKTLEPFIAGYADYYIRYTYAAAAIKTGNTKKAKEQLEKAMAFPKSNPDIFTGKILQAFLNGGNGFNDKETEKLIKSAADSGNKTVDSRLIDQAMILYKSNKPEEAEKILKETLKISKNRAALIRRFIKYSKERMT